MHRRIALFLALSFLTSYSLLAQDVTGTETKTAVKKPSRDFIMVQLTYDNWLNTPDSVDLTGFGRGANLYLCYDFPIAKSNFSFAAGIGIGTSSVFLNNRELVLTDTGSAAVARFAPESKEYKSFKFSTTYLEAPFELRFFGNKENRNTGFKAAIGLRVGTLVGAHTKGRHAVDGSKVTDKVNTKRFLENWRYAGTVRLGWGNFTLFGAYSLGGVFKEGKGPDVTPYSVGLCITGL
ncbi:MAG TPA: outer membrane beta-barrel protein [Flavipsychrobacter sp.]|nr:outer membrane beta-barrel protein [Flavipsychrobacter sp.]